MSKVYLLSYLNKTWKWSDGVYLVDDMIWTRISGVTAKEHNGLGVRETKW